GNSLRSQPRSVVSLMRDAGSSGASRELHSYPRHETEHLSTQEEDDPASCRVDAVPNHLLARDLDRKIGAVIVAQHHCRERDAIFFDSAGTPLRNIGLPARSRTTWGNPVLSNFSSSPRRVCWYRVPMRSRQRESRQQ